MHHHCRGGLVLDPLKLNIVSLSTQIAILGRERIDFVIIDFNRR